MRGKTLLVFIALGAVIAFWMYRKYRVAPDLAIEHLELVDLNGNEFDEAQLRGKTVFVNYWATWCGDCLQEMPSIEAAYRQSDTNSVVFLMISDDPAEKIQRYLSQHNYPMKFVRVNKRLQELGINTIPTTYIFDDEGDEVFTKVGSGDWTDPEILQLLNQ